jgi:hypothetical protein
VTRIRLILPLLAVALICCEGKRVTSSQPSVAHVVPTVPSNGPTPGPSGTLKLGAHREQLPGGESSDAGDDATSALPAGLTPEIADFYLKFRDAVVHDDRDYVAEHIQYPIQLTLDGKASSAVMIRNSREFLKRYDDIMLDGIKDVIARSGVDKLIGTAAGPFRLYRGQLFIYYTCPSDPARICEDGPVRVHKINNDPRLAE